MRKMSEIELQMYSEKLREQILKDLKELSTNIKTNVDCPEKAQDLDLLISIHDLIDECLNNWRY
jgi:hypothetical protein